MLIVYLLLLIASSLAYIRPPSPPILYDVEDAENIFEDYINKYNKEYASEQEKQDRFNIFKEQLEIINRIRLEQPQASFDVHKYSDRTKDELRSRHFGLMLETSTIEPERIFVRDDLPDQFDWRDYNAVTPVKDQQNCGSCWAFSTTGTIEGAYAIKYKRLVSFSEQQLVACDTFDNRCNGGNWYRALTYLKMAGGIETEYDYPYEDQNGTCYFEKRNVVAKVSGYKVIKLGNDRETKQALIDYGPISISVNPESPSFYNYNGNGIIQCPAPSYPYRLGHAVLLVGYGTENGKPYWIIKNSWGTEHGREGYWLVEQGNNPCGMDYATGAVAVVY